MAIRYAIANGNWSATATWDGGTLPTTDDDVYANSYTVTIDQDIEVAKISTEVCPTTSVGGGGFITGPYNGNRYITANIVAGTSICLVHNSATTLLYITGDITGGSVANAYGYLNNVTTYGSVGISPIIVGNITAGSGMTSYGLQTRTDRSYSPTIIGNITASANSIGARITYYDYAVNITGNITSVNGYNGVTGVAGVTGNMYVTGIMTSSIGTSGWAVNTAGKLYVSGIGVCSSDGNLPFAHTTNCKVFIQTGEDFTLIMTTEDASTKTLYTDFDQPLESDVREGVEYGSSAYTGTCVVPPAESVVANVPVDDTVGTYALSGDLITRLGKCATTEEVDSTVAAYNS